MKYKAPSTFEGGILLIVTGTMHSHATTEALELFAVLIRAGRIRRGWTMDELAERLGSTRTTVRRIEHGEPGVAMGTAFEAARLVGVSLFGDDATSRDRLLTERRNELSLLPKAVRPSKEASYDF